MPDTDNKTLGEAIGKIASGTFVVTAKSGDESTGFLASWVQQAAFEPPLISLAVKADRAIKPLLDAGGSFVVNVVAVDDQTLFSHFAKGFAPGEDAFDGVEYAAGQTGAPILAGALAYVECTVHSTVPAGDHVLYLGEAVAGAVTDASAQPSVRLRKSGFGY